MSNQIKNSQRKNLIFIIVTLIMLMLAVNLTIYFVSNNYMVNKIEEENSEFLLLTTYLIDENDLSVALEYISHYSDSHSVEVEIYEDDLILYSSVDESFTFSTYSISTNKGNFDIRIDNSHSITVDLLSQKYMYANLISIGLFIFSITTLFLWNRMTSKKIESDVDHIMDFVHSEIPKKHEYSFVEFQRIHQNMEDYIAEIDMHRERKQLNIKGLVHDIKTPLTVINNYVQSTTDTSSDKENAELSIKRISKLIETLIKDDYQSAFIPIQLHDIIVLNIEYYRKIFTTKQLTIDYQHSSLGKVKWNQRDFKVVLENMFSNAYYYSDVDTTFSIDLFEKDQYIVLTFTSEGNVESLKDIKQLFTKGYRDKSTKDLNESGRGVGLYLTKLLLQPIKASINASTKDNKITFTIQIKKD